MEKTIVDGLGYIYNRAIGKLELKKYELHIPFMQKNEIDKGIMCIIENQRRLFEMILDINVLTTCSIKGASNGGDFFNNTSTPPL